jgi:hypothetical protein
MTNDDHCRPKLGEPLRELHEDAADCEEQCGSHDHSGEHCYPRSFPRVDSACQECRAASSVYAVTFPTPLSVVVTRAAGLPESQLAVAAALPCGQSCVFRGLRMRPARQVWQAKKAECAFAPAQFEAVHTLCLRVHQRQAARGEVGGRADRRRAHLITQD